MAEVLIAFDDVVAHGEREYRARVCGREVEHGSWEGWLEFTPLDGGAPLRTPRETRQPNRADLRYWATGLTHAYLEGALERALHPVAVAPAGLDVRPAFDEPLPGPGAGAARAAAATERAVLDPFAVHAQGEDVLRAQLRALSREQLERVARAHALEVTHGADAPALADEIVRAVHARLAADRSRA